jgi:hypothetical protein
VQQPLYTVGDCMADVERHGADHVSRLHSAFICGNIAA